MKRKSVNMVIQLSEEQKKEVSAEIDAYYLDVRGEEIGIIEREQILELFLENLAPVIYNRALDDAQRWFKQAQENLEMDYDSLYRDLR